MRKLAVLISDGGTGSNLQAIINAIENETLEAQIAVVVSDTSGAYGLKRATKHNIPLMIVDRKDDLTEILGNTYNIDYIVLAGWKMIVPDVMIDVFQDHILNLHPGLIPDTMDGTVLCPDGSKGLWNRGKYTDKALQNFLDQKATYAGSTVHFLSKEFDFGRVLKRCFVKIKPYDTTASLYDRLKSEEHRIYVGVLKTLCK